jgi:hypothetical protein
MKSRVIVGCALVALVLGAQAAAASATPVVWLNNFLFERAAPGTPSSAIVNIGGGCQSFQEGTLVSNGLTADELTFAAPATAVNECEGGKLAATVSGAVVKAASGEGVTMTTKGVVHVLVRPWCVYALPKAISFTKLARTEGSGTVTGTLDKAATFGSCAATRTFPLTIAVEEAYTGSPFFTEVVG